MMYGKLLSLINYDYVFCSFFRIIAMYYKIIEHDIGPKGILLLINKAAT